MTREEWGRSWKPWLRGSFLGFPFGALPAGGTEIPTFLSYFLEKKLAKKPEEFGKGAIEGVAGPEAANNSAVAGVLVPLLTLGLPTSATAAILLAAFQQYGLQPGPLLFTNPGTSTLVWGLIASLYHRQRHAAAAQPAAGRHVGAAAVDPDAAALWRHPGVRHPRRLLVQPVGVRPRPAVLVRRRRICDAPLRLPGRAGHHRHDPRPARRREFPPRALDHPGRLFGVRHAPDLGRAAGDRLADHRGAVPDAAASAPRRLAVSS